MTNATITLRKATPKDAADLIILDNLASHGMSLAFWQHAVNEGEADDPLDFARQRFLEPDNIFGFSNAIVAEKDGILVGSITGYEMENSDDDVDEIKKVFPAFGPVFDLFALAIGNWFVDSLAVFESERNQGIAEKLLQACIYEGIERRYSVISLVVEDGNEPAVKLYEAKGFETTNSLPFCETDPKGKSNNWLLMTKNI